MISPSDESLIALSKRGQTDAFGELVRRYQGMVQGYAYHLVGSFEDAQDIAQEVFVTVYRKLAQLRGAERFPSWLKRITANACRMRQRKRVTLQRVVETLANAPTAEGVPSPAQECERRELRAAVREALDELGEKNRLVVALYYLDGSSYADIARFLNVSVSAVEGRMHRAKQQLKGRLAEMGGESLRQEKLPQDFAQKVLRKVLNDAFSIMQEEFRVVTERRQSEGETAGKYAAHFGVHRLRVESGKLLNQLSSHAMFLGEPEVTGERPLIDMFHHIPFAGVNVLSAEIGEMATDVDGTRDTFQAPDRGERLDSSSRLVSRSETVQVPSIGTFDHCALIETTRTPREEAAEEETRRRTFLDYCAGVVETWYAPGVGLVRVLYKHRNGQETDIRLVEYGISTPDQTYFPLAINNRWRYRWTDEPNEVVYEDTVRVVSNEESGWQLGWVTQAYGSRDDGKG